MVLVRKIFTISADMYAQTRSRGFGRVVTQRILIGNYVLSARQRYYNSAKRVGIVIASAIS